MLNAAVLLLVATGMIGGADLAAAEIEFRLAQGDGSRQIVVEDKAEAKSGDKDDAKSEGATSPGEKEDGAGEKEIVKDEPKEVIVKDEPKAVVKEKVIIEEKVIVEEEPKAEVKEEVIVKEIVKEEPPLVVVLQTELKRVGCYHGSVDGVWGDGSSEALHDFYHYSSFRISSFEPTPDALALVKGKKGVVCLAHDRPQDDYGSYDSDGGYGGGGYNEGY